MAHLYVAALYLESKDQRGASGANLKSLSALLSAGHQAVVDILAEAASWRAEATAGGGAGHAREPPEMLVTLLLSGCKALDAVRRVAIQEVDTFWQALKDAGGAVESVTGKIGAGRVVEEEWKWLMKVLRLNWKAIQEALR